MERFEVVTNRREQLVEITARVCEAVASSGVQRGVAHVYSPHTTAGITVNENADPDVAADILDGLERLVPQRGGWRHREGNADSHLKASLVGVGVLVPVDSGLLALGTWQGIYLCEFDGPRKRAVLVSILGE